MFRTSIVILSYFSKLCRALKNNTESLSHSFNNAWGTIFSLLYIVTFTQKRYFYS